MIQLPVTSHGLNFLIVQKFLILETFINFALAELKMI